MRNWRDRINEFMVGRYGEDALSRFLLVAALILLLLNFFVQMPAFGIFAGLILVWVYYRMLSKDTGRRAEENEKYLQLRDKVTGFFRGKGSSSSAADGYRIYRCPKCGQKIRIPKGHGMVEITCPRCRTRFRKRT